MSSPGAGACQGLDEAVRGAAQRTPGRAARTVPAVLAGAVVALQAPYPFLGSEARSVLTIVTVVVFFAASTGHALAWRGARFTALLVAVTAGGGLAVELAGVHTGWPFGEYRYTGTLGPQAAGVPLVIPLAWTMMAYPALLVGKVITTQRVAGPLVAGWALASWDLFLDPQMVDAGHWVWAAGGPAVLGIPLSNFAGWTLVAVVMMALLWPATAPAGGDRPLLLLYLWVYGSSLVAHLLFFGLPGAALLGGAGMGVVAAALLRALRRSG